MTPTQNPSQNLNMPQPAGTDTPTQNRETYLLVPGIPITPANLRRRYPQGHPQENQPIPPTETAAALQLSVGWVRAAHKMMDNQRKKD